MPGCLRYLRVLLFRLRRLRLACIARFPVAVVRIVENTHCQQVLRAKHLLKSTLDQTAKQKYMLPPHSLPSNKPRLMLAIRNRPRQGESMKKVRLSPRRLSLSRARMPIAGFPGFLFVRTVEKHPLSTSASREAPVDKCARRHGG